MKKLSEIYESTWGGILDRGSGEKTREEDDVNHLEFYDFVHYLEEKYPPKNKHLGIVTGHNYRDNNIIYLSIPIKRYDNLTQRLRIEVDEKTLKYTGSIEVSKYLYDEYEYSLFSKKILGKKYKILYNFKFEDYVLRPIDGEITNSTIVELIDTVLHNVDNPLLNIDVNESTWGGMLDRGSGDTVRKEDEYNPEYIDFGPETTVYWSDCALEIDGEVKFDYDWINGWIKYNGDGWRLPTVEEVKQLKWMRGYYNLKPFGDFKSGCIWFHIGNNMKNPVFDEKNVLKLERIPNKTSTIDQFWTNDVFESDDFWNGSPKVYGFNNEGKFSIKVVNKDNKYPVFLVKDKKSED